MPAQTAEKKIRAKDGTVDWVLLVGGYDENAVSSRRRTRRSSTAPPTRRAAGEIA